jgi:HEPN domain-containing protein
LEQKEIVQYWINKSKDELKSANIMLDAGQFSYTGFMCHQAIEKVLKAYYIYLKDEIHPYEHKLKNLIKMTNLSDIIDEDKNKIIEKLEPLYIKTRYEDYKNTISKLLTKPYCETLISETEDILKWIIELMK